MPYTEPLTQRETDDLEQVLDRRGLAAILDALTHIAYAKGQHVRENWQDERTAKDWDATARKLDRHTADIVKYCPLA